LLRGAEGFAAVGDAVGVEGVQIVHVAVEVDAEAAIAAVLGEHEADPLPLDADAKGEVGLELVNPNFGEAEAFLEIF